MSRDTTCPLCHKAVYINPDSYGDDFACPQCGGTIRAVLSIDGKLMVLPSSDPTTFGSRKFVFHCGRCNTALEARARQSGLRGQCPTCGAGFTVPRIDPTTGRAESAAMVPDDGQLPTPMHAYATAGANAPRIRTLANGEQVIECPRCHASNTVDADVCGQCGLPFTMEGAEAISVPGPSSNTHATAALTVGVIAALTFCGPAVVLGPIAIALGISGYLRADLIEGPNSGRGMAIAGIAFGFIGVGGFLIQVLGWL